MKILYQYFGYLHEEVVTCNEAISQFNLAEQVEHFDSSGYLDPIYSTGLAPKYRIAIIDMPEWLLAGVLIGTKDGRWYNCGTPELIAAKLFTGDLTGFKLYSLVRKSGKFADKLKKYFAEHGYLTGKQTNYI